MSTFIVRRAKEHALKIQDSTSPMVLRVTNGDITKATQKNAKCCAYARAAKRLPHVKAAYFFRTTAYLEYDDRLERYHLPLSVQKEIVSFDRAKVMAPGTYQIIPPKGASALGAVRARSKKHNANGRSPSERRNKSGIKRGVVHKTQLIRTLQEPVG